MSRTSYVGICNCEICLVISKYHSTNAVKFNSDQNHERVRSDLVDSSGSSYDTMNGLDAPQRHFITLCIVIEAFITYVREASLTAVGVFRAIYGDTLDRAETSHLSAIRRDRDRKPCA